MNSNTEDYSRTVCVLFVDCISLFYQRDTIQKLNGPHLHENNAAGVFISLAVCLINNNKELIAPSARISAPIRIATVGLVYIFNAIGDYGHKNTFLEVYLFHLELSNFVC
jgi:hypothetical protein